MTCPCRLRSMEFAGRPGMNSWIVTSRPPRVDLIHRASGSRSITSRFHAWAAVGRTLKSRHAANDSSSARENLMPFPPHSPSTFKTLTDSWSWCHVTRSCALRTRMVLGTRMPRFSAVSSNWKRLLTIEKPSGEPIDRSIKSLSVGSRRCSSCSCATTPSSQGMTTSGGHSLKHRRRLDNERMPR